jgi:hypothetical protein
MNDTSTYDLERIKELVVEGRRIITLSALRGARSIGLEEDEIVDAVLALKAADFYKTMPAEKIPGLWQDVYRPNFRGVDLYVKLQITGQAVIISFKRL